MADDRAPDDARDLSGVPALPPAPPVTAPPPYGAAQELHGSAERPLRMDPWSSAPAPDASGDAEPYAVATTPAVDDSARAAAEGARAPEPVGTEPRVEEPPVKAAAGRKKHGSFLRELPVLLVIAFALALLIKAFLIQAFYIPSGSMEQTLQVRDRVLVNKLVYRFRDIHRGEIVVFNGLDSFTPETVVPPPANAFDSAMRKLKNAIGLGAPGEKDFIKRVIGIPGDTVACCVDGKVTVNGEAIDEPYVFENNEQEFGPELVPEGELFVMGDHRGASDDSRAKGTVPADKVIGRAFVVIWPPKHFKGLKVPPELEGRPSALPSEPWSLAVVPPVLGLVGAVPLHLLQRGVRRRWRRRRG